MKAQLISTAPDFIEMARVFWDGIYKRGLVTKPFQDLSLYSKCRLMEVAAEVHAISSRALEPLVASLKDDAEEATAALRNAEQELCNEPRRCRDCKLSETQIDNQYRDAT